MEDEKLFFEKNDIKVCKKASKVMLILVVAFPILFFMSWIGVWSTPIPHLVIMSIIGVIAIVSPTIGLKMNIPISVMKYVGVIGIAVAVSAMGADSTMGIYMTYGLALAVSCMYFDKKFTRNICLIVYLPVMISLFFKYDFVVKKFIAVGSGYTVEYIAMSIIFVSIAGAARKLLVSLHDTEHVKRVVSNCEEASNDLVCVVEKLAKAVDDTQMANQQIVVAADKTLDDCNKSMRHVEHTNHSIEQMIELADLITTHTEEMIKIADNTNDAMGEYVHLMDDAVLSMRNIEKSANTTGKVIDNLTNCMQEISSFAGTISQITSQTNLLALNASIEAARAGDNGRGFAVVAEQVRILAEQSKAASDSISGLIGTIGSAIEAARRAIDQNKDSVEGGIGMIQNAKDKAVDIGQLQADTKSKAEQVYECSNTTKKHSNEVVKMAEEMAGDVQHTLEQTNAISEAAQTQSEITVTLDDSFHKVDEISKNLLELSSSVEV